MDTSTLSRQAKFRTALPLIAALWATGVALYLIFAPTYSASVSVYGPNTSPSEGWRTEASSRSTALAVNGPGILFALTIPIVLALSPLAIRKHQRAALLTAGALMLGFCILGALSIGVYYLPTALLLLLAGARTDAESAHVI